MEILEKSKELLVKIERSKKLYESFKQGEIHFRVLNTYQKDRSLFPDFIQIKCILQKQLPKMPKDYIIRQLFDVKHRTLVMKTDRVIGGICYRPFYEHNFCEIVFCAMDSDSQIKGHGSFLMDFLKEHTKHEYDLFLADKEAQKSARDRAFNTIGVYTFDSVIHPVDSYLNPKYSRPDSPLYYITYADNYAIGYFKKQGFQLELTFDSWIGVIKDYDGGTLMQCKIIQDVNYILKDTLIDEVRVRLLSLISSKTNCNTVYKKKDFKGVDPFLIPGMKEGKLTKEMLLESQAAGLGNSLRFILSDLQANASSWPFMQPVSAEEVPDYYNVIKLPMDLQTMETKIANAEYITINDFVQDFKQMISNCYLYNAPLSVYFKCAQKLDEYFETRIALFKK